MRGILMVLTILLVSPSVLAQDIHLGEVIFVSGKYCRSYKSFDVIATERIQHGDAAADKLFEANPGCGLLSELVRVADLVRSRTSKKEGLISVLILQRSSGERVWTAVTGVRVVGGP